MEQNKNQGKPKEVLTRKLEDLNLLDDFLFTAVASYGEEGRQLCQTILEIILGRKLPILKVETQKVLPAVDISKHGIRMDVYISDAEIDESGNSMENNIYDIEMENGKFTPKRARYYHALADRKLLLAGDDYSYLGNVFVIIIMPQDPFGKDRIMYTIKRMVKEDTSIEYEDGDTTFYLYTKGTITDGNQELKDLLEYIEDSVQQNAKNRELRRLHEIIEKVKHDKEVGVAFMKSYERERQIREEAREEERKNTELQRQRAEKAEAERKEIQERSEKEKEKMLKDMAQLEARIKELEEKNIPIK